MKLIFIDESGYTGTDLLNMDQPFQGASAICVSELEAKDLIEKHFPKIRTNELKYRSLARRKSNWKNLFNLQKDLLDNYTCVTYVCDKKFLLILHFLDYAVEPFYHEQGINFYEDGQNYSLASLLYYAAETLLGNNHFSDVLSLFQYAVNSKTDISVSALVEKVKTIEWEKLPEAFGPLALENLSCINAIKNIDVSSDGAFVVLFSLISRLETVIGCDYSIIHDRSKNLEQYDTTLYKMINHKDNVTFRETKLTSLSFPLKLKGVIQVDSKDSYGVQLADVLVGGIMDSAKALIGVKVNDYNQQIINLYSDNQLIHLLPSLDFDQQKEFRKNTEGNDVIDYFSKHFR